MPPRGVGGWLGNPELGASGGEGGGIPGLAWPPGFVLWIFSLTLCSVLNSGSERGRGELPSFLTPSAPT